MAITTNVHICNLALDRCKEKNITSMEENTKSAQKCSDWYDLTRKSLLINLNATFSIKRAVLAEVEDYEPVYGYKKAYRLPKDCLQVQCLGDPIDNNLYQIEGDYLYHNCNLNQTEIKYIADIQDVTKFDAEFIQLFALTLASNICEPLTHDTEQANRLKNLADEKYIETSTKYGRDNRITVIKSSRFREAKLNAGIEHYNYRIR